MNREEIFKKVQSFIAEEMLIPKEEICTKIKMEADLSDDLNMGSLDRLDVYIKLENHFNYHFSDRDVYDIEKVKDIVDILYRDLA